MPPNQSRGFYGASGVGFSGQGREDRMTRTSFEFSDMSYDQPMQWEPENSSAASSRKPPQHHSWELTVKGSGPVDKGDVIMGKDWGEDEGERVRVGPVVVPEIEIIERGWEEAVGEVVFHAEHLLNQVMRAGDVSKVVQKAFEMWSIVSTKADAVAWGEEHHPGPSMLPELEAFAASHESELKAAGDFDTFVERKFTNRLQDRLNWNRISRNLHPSNPELRRMKSLAKGIVVPLAEGFVPTSKPPGHTQLYQEVSKAVDGQFLKQVRQGLVLVLTEASATKIPGIHFSSPHWAKNVGKPQGRPIFNASDATLQKNMLNGDQVKAAAQDVFGAIQLPTIKGIMKMILDFKAKSPRRPWSDVTVWKMDLKGAFTLLSFRPDQVKLLAMQIMGGLVLLFVCGVFGWTAMPAAFAVLTRAIIWELVRRKITATMYVDDIIGVSWTNSVLAEQSAVKVMLNDLLGEEAVADEKTVRTTEREPRIVVLGWCIDMHKQIVTISERNLLKAIYCFFSVDLTADYVPVRLLVQCASLATRYEMICCVLRPFSRALYASYTGRHRAAKVELREDAKWAIRLWRTMLCCTSFAEGTFARSFESFRPKPAGHLIQFDASTTGIGVWIRTTDQPGTIYQQSIGAGGLSIRSWNVSSESDYQNVAEFTGALVGLIALVRDCVEKGIPKPKGVTFKGDSISALTWLDKAKHKGSLAFGASTILNLIVVRYRIQIVGTDFIPGDINNECDSMSRDTHSCVAFGYNHVRELNLDNNPFITEALRLSNPTLVDHYMKNFETFWCDANKLVLSLDPRQV